MNTRDKSIQHSGVQPRWLFAALIALLVAIGPRLLDDVDLGRRAGAVEPLLAKGDEGGKATPGPVDHDADDEPASFIAWTAPAQAQPTPRGVVLAVVYAPDGRILASAGEDKQIRLQDVASGRTLATLAGHEDVVAALAFAPTAGPWPRPASTAASSSGTWSPARKGHAQGAQELGLLGRLRPRRQDAGLGRLRQAGQALGRGPERRGRHPRRPPRLGARRLPSPPTARPWPRGAPIGRSSSGASPNARSGRP